MCKSHVVKTNEWKLQVSYCKNEVAKSHITQWHYLVSFYKEKHDSNYHPHLLRVLWQLNYKKKNLNEVICYSFSNVNKGEPLTINVTSST